MKFDNDNNVLTLYLSGRIDANNSADIESEITQVLADNPASSQYSTLQSWNTYQVQDYVYYSSSANNSGEL